MSTTTLELTKTVSTTASRDFSKAIQKEVEDCNKKYDAIKVNIFPHDYLISTSSQCFYEHLVTNASPFAIVCRVRATSATFFRIANNSFVLQPGEGCQLVIERLPRPIKSHRITIEVIPYIPQPSQNSLDNLHYLFESHPFPRHFHVRYHQLPTWHSTSQRMSQRREIAAAEYPKLVEVLRKTGILSQRDASLSLNQLNLMEMAISNDTGEKFK
ncbi:unnamed protein product [Caenorhabditis angaria]|uniref:MSP domain-containing protein n=1 Tax=Caenorhabditis angaria TaxID=860376 RepID=A0A9P1MYG8_9PELO|nr:unnamed protein product [Caenorhabditis angaria]